MAEEMTTYRLADGGDIDGHAWVSTLEWFDELSCDYLELVEERWALVSRSVVKLGPLDRYCDVCEVSVILYEPCDGPVFCEAHTP